MRAYAYGFVIFLLVLSLLSCNLVKPARSMDDDIDWGTVTAKLVDDTDTPLSDIIVGAVDAVTNRVFSGVTAADGTVSLRVPQNRSFIFTIISKDGKSFGSAVIHGSSSRNGVPSVDTMGLKSPDSAVPLDLGSVTVPDDPGSEAIAVTVADAAVDPSITAHVDPITGVPLGIGGLGRPGIPSSVLPAGTYSGDPDLDGLPNIIDSDDDGDGFLDDFDKDDDGDGVADTDEGVSESIPAELLVGYLLDIRGGEGIHSYFNGDEYNALIRDMRVDLMFRIYDQARIDAVESVALYAASSPAYAATLIPSEFDTDDTTQYFVDGTSYDPGTVSCDWDLLENGDGVIYQIPVNMNDTTGERLECRVGLKLPESSADLYEAGDVFTVEVRYTAESGFATEYYSEMINFIYENVTRFQAYAVMDSGSTPTASDFTPVWDGTPGSPYPGDAANPIELTYDSLDQDIWFKIIPPQDDDGDYITDGGFRYEIFDTDAVTPARSLGVWQEPEDGHCRYDSDLDDELYVDGVSPPYFAVPIPVEYIVDTDENLDTNIDIEYFMNINDDSYIKNRLRFSIAPST